MLLFAVMIFGSQFATYAQKENKEEMIKPLLGIWQYVEEVVKADGSKIYIGKDIY